MNHKNFELILGATQAPSTISGHRRGYETIAGQISEWQLGKLHSLPGPRPLGNLLTCYLCILNKLKSLFAMAGGFIVCWMMMMGNR